MKSLIDSAFLYDVLAHHVHAGHFDLVSSSFSTPGIARNMPSTTFLGIPSPTVGSPAAHTTSSVAGAESPFLACGKKVVGVDFESPSDLAGSWLDTSKQDRQWRQSRAWPRWQFGFKVFVDGFRLFVPPNRFTANVARNSPRTCFAGVRGGRKLAARSLSASD